MNMKIVAIFLLSVALFSAADSAPSPDTGKTDQVAAAPVSTASVPVSIHHAANPVSLPETSKKTEDTTSSHTGADPQPAAPVIQSSTQAPAAPGPSDKISTAATLRPNPDPLKTNPANNDTTTKATPSSSTTTAAPATTSTSPTTSTTAPPTTTLSPKPTTPTTPKPTTPTTPKPTTPTTLTPTTAKPVPVSTQAPKPAERHFDGPSFIGGAVLVLGLGAISGVLYMFYKSRTDQNYRTL